MAGNIRKSKVSMTDIALKAGVSKGTVSKAINGVADVSPELRKRILDICEKMEYRIDCNIQDLVQERKSGMTRNIGFVMVGLRFSDPAYAEMLDGAIRGSVEHNLRLSLIWLSGNERRIYDLPETLRDRRVAGVLISGYVSEEILKLLKDIGITCVVIGNYSEKISGQVHAIEQDIGYVMCQTVEMLKKNGHEKTAFFAEVQNNHYYSSVCEALQRALKLNGLGVQPELIYWGKEARTGLSEKLRQDIASSKPPFDSIVCLDHRTAFDIIQEILFRSPSGLQKDVVVVMPRLHKYYKFLVPVILIESHFENMALEGIKILSEILRGDDVRIQKRLVRAELTLELPSAGQ